MSRAGQQILGDVLFVAVLEEVPQLAVSVLRRDDQRPFDPHFAFGHRNQIAGILALADQIVRQLALAKREQRITHRPRDLDRFPSLAKLAFSFKIVEKHGRSPV
ncbi:MAG: hypothetical protein R3C99_22315 [Pirellulaceae bacterium]